MLAIFSSGLILGQKVYLVYFSRKSRISTELKEAIRNEIRLINRSLCCREYNGWFQKLHWIFYTRKRLILVRYNFPYFSIYCSTRYTVTFPSEISPSDNSPTSFRRIQSSRLVGIRPHPTFTRLVKCVVGRINLAVLWCFYQTPRGCRHGSRGMVWRGQKFFLLTMGTYCINFAIFQTCFL